MQTYKRALILLFAVLPFTGCAFRTHPIVNRTSNAVLKDATLEQLVEIINTNADRLNSLRALPVNIDSSVLEEKKNQVKDNPEVSGWVLIRKPQMLHMRVLAPVVHSTMIDMVSDGKEFKLWIPSKNRFVIGRNDAEVVNPKQPLESIRPQMLYDALLIREIDPAEEIAVLENGYETVLDSKRHLVEQPDYQIVVVRRGKEGWYLSRKIIFSRTDLQPHRQLIYDENGQLATDVRYGDYKDYDGIKFPTQIEIERPLLSISTPPETVDPGVASGMLTPPTVTLASVRTGRLRMNRRSLPLPS